MDTAGIEQQLSEVKDRISTEDVTVLKAASQPFPGFEFEDMSLTEFVEKGLELGVDDIYLLENRTEDGEVARGGVCFYYNNQPHTRIIEASRSDDQVELGTQGPPSSTDFRFGREESEEEQQRKEELAAELLNEYEEYLDEDERFEIENRLDRMRLRRLLRMRDEAEEKASVDPDLEKEVAHSVNEAEEFNQTDTEMLLDQLDVEFDSNQVRIGEVHTRAKSLLKINR